MSCPFGELQNKCLLIFSLYSIIGLRNGIHRSGDPVRNVFLGEIKQFYHGRSSLSATDTIITQKVISFDHMFIFLYLINLCNCIF